MKKTLIALCAVCALILTFSCSKDDPYNGHEFVDLGLPSGTLCATCNVGAKSEADDCSDFAWGETKEK